MIRNLFLTAVVSSLFACGSESSPMTNDVDASEARLTSKSSALWEDWHQLTIATRDGVKASDFTVWEPGQKGTPHKIKYCNQADIINGGEMESYWQRIGDASWTKFSTDGVWNTCYENDLWTGSSDIRYKFVFYAYSRTTFYWRFYKAWW